MQNGSGQWWRPLADARWVVFLVVATVAVFSFIVSYSHIYDLGRVHAQSGTAARLLPLTVDLLIVASSLVLFIQYRENGDPKGLAFWMPRVVLYAAIGATVAANVFYGLPFGWLSAALSGWPGAAFVAAVEVGILVARPDERGRGPSPARGSPAARPGTVPSSSFEAAKARMRFADEHGFKYSDNEARAQFGLKRSEVTAARREVTPGRSRGGTECVPSTAPAAQDTPAGAPSPLAPAGVLNGQAHGR